LTKNSKQPLLPTWLSLTLAITFVITGLIVSVFVFLTAEAVVEAANQPFNPLEEAAREVSATALPPLVQEGPIPVASPVPGEPTPTPISMGIDALEDDRVTILIMGIDRRPGEPFISRTDTMMLLSLNQETGQASLLSIPRDLYVVIPGRGRDRINTAMVYGSAGNNPAGGAALAMQTIEYNLGVPVDHYFMVDFNTFIRAVDAIGGITVEVPYDISDPRYPDMNYGYDPLYIPAGTHHFDGQQALKYARTRHQDNDFYRAQRQQQVLMAIRSQILSMGAEKMLQQLPLLYQQFRDGVRTDLSLQQMLQLANLARTIEAENINRAVLDHNYVVGHRTAGGASVLVLINDRAAPLIQELFYYE
jgi:LCP family protein required for cell wall assembly